MRRLLATLAVTTCLLTSVPAVTWANGLSGLTLFGGIKRENQLSYRLDFGGQRNAWDRYRLRIPQKKMSLAAAKFIVAYPSHFKGEFDPKKVEIRVKGKAVPLSDVEWNKQDRAISIYPKEPVAAGNAVELVFSNVQNPPFGGMFYFNCMIQTPGDVPLPRYLGTWQIDVQ
jgi:hypothetical protein